MVGVNTYLLGLARFCRSGTPLNFKVGVSLMWVGVLFPMGTQVCYLSYGVGVVVSVYILAN